MNGTREFIVRHLLCLWIKNYWAFVLSRLSLSLLLSLSLSLAIEILRDLAIGLLVDQNTACFCVPS